ncbi:MAG: hypothetical protein AB1540_01860 [Bdellovibrionota bacterium]
MFKARLLLLISFFFAAGCASDSSDGQPASQIEIDSVKVDPIETVYGTVYPLDADSIDLDAELDAGNNVVRIKSKLSFAIATHDHKPMLALPADASNLVVSLDSKSLDKNELKPVTIPLENGNRYHVLDQILSEGGHIFEFEYTLPAQSSFLSRFADINGKGLQAYVPCNPMLYDRFHFFGKMSVANAGETYRFYSNATTSDLDNNSWSFAHSVRVNALAPYFHLLPESAIVGSATRTYQGAAGPITIHAYRTDAAAPNTTGAIDVIEASLAKYEGLLGPYAHGNKFIAYITTGSGGMEHSGATVSSLSALKHEVFHSWFATGVFPRFYSDAWIDEALARWFDNSSPVESLAGSTKAVRLAGYSPYQLYFPTDAYNYGSKLIAHLASLAGGRDRFMQFLSEFYQQNKLQTVTTEIFLDFMKSKLGVDLNGFFATYIYGGRSSTSDRPDEVISETSFAPKSGLEAPLTEGSFLREN